MRRFSDSSAGCAHSSALPGLVSNAAVRVVALVLVVDLVLLMVPYIRGKNTGWRCLRIGCEEDICIWDGEHRRLEKIADWWASGSVLIQNTRLFKMIVGVLTTRHTQYTWDRSIYLHRWIKKFLEFSFMVCSSYAFLRLERSLLRWRRTANRWHATDSLEWTRFSCWCL